MPRFLPAGKYTQGNWHLSGQFDADTTIEVVVGDVPGEEIAICAIAPIGEEWSEEEIANARLLAASKRILEALQSAVRCLAEILAETATSGSDYGLPNVARKAQLEAASIAAILWELEL